MDWIQYYFVVVLQKNDAGENVKLLLSFRTVEQHRSGLSCSHAVNLTDSTVKSKELTKSSIEWPSFSTIETQLALLTSKGLYCIDFETRAEREQFVAVLAPPDRASERVRRNTGEISAIRPGF